MTTFGKRLTPPPTQNLSEPTSSGGDGGAGSDFPWSTDEHFIACNLASGDLMLNLPARLEVEGRLHAETLLASAGAIAGFAAQHALFAQYGGAPPELVTAQTRSGETFYFGDRLNDTLICLSEDEGRLKLQSLVLGAAVAGGVPPKELPPLEPMFAHVARSIGADGGFFPSTPEARPHLPVADLLRLTWPVASACFNGELSGKVLPYGASVPQRWRPVIAARAAHVFMRRTKDVLNPRTAVIVVMESAIYASKLAPAKIESAAVL